MALIHITSSPAAPERSPIPLFDTDNVRQIELQALAKIQPDEMSLMKRAGLSLFRLICACYPHARHIWVAAGTGHNGGDAIEAAALLHQAGKHVQVNWLGSPNRMSVDTAQAVLAARNSGLELHSHKYNITDIPSSVDLIIDGLLGIGLDPQRGLSQRMEQFITSINQHTAPVVSVDVPSGLPPGTGHAHSACVRADTTLTFLCAKPGLFTADGREYCGDIWLDTLDNVPPDVPPNAYLNGCGNECFSKRAQNTNKGSHGDVAIVGGATGMTGAAILAGRAAMAAGAGRVYVAPVMPNEDEPMPVSLDIRHPELMFRPPELIDIEQCTIVCGCGGGKIIENVLPPLLKQCLRLLLDADALNAISESSELQHLLGKRAGTRFSTIITPHPLEAARLLHTHTADIQANRLAAAQGLATRFQCICVLKGSGTVIAAPGITPFINCSGNAALASAGTGDVLAGWIAGHWSAQLSTDKLQKLAAHCVWTHGDAADRWQRVHHSPSIAASTLLNWLQQ